MGNAYPPVSLRRSEDRSIFSRLLEREYQLTRADPRKRILYGYSSSGFFVMYTLANAPDLFHTYLAGSPDTDLSAVYLPAHDQKLLSQQAKDPIDLYLSIGSLEGEDQSSLPTYPQLVANFQAKNYPGLRLITDIYEGENHGSGGATLTLINDLRKCFSSKE